MRIPRDPLRLFSLVAVVAPTLFVAAMVLYFMDRQVGEAYRVEQGGVVGLAANLSLIGLTAIVRFLIVFGPQFLILLSIALPVVGALYAVERIDTRRQSISRRRRSLLWVLACGESMVMLGLFVLAFEVLQH